MKRTERQWRRRRVTSSHDVHSESKKITPLRFSINIYQTAEKFLLKLYTPIGRLYLRTTTTFRSLMSYSDSHAMLSASSSVFLHFIKINAKNHDISETI